MILHCTAVCAQHRKPDWSNSAPAEAVAVLNHPYDAALQGRLGLDARQVEAIKGMHRRLADQLLNVAAERLHISGLIQVHLSPGTCPNNTSYLSAQELV